MLCSNINIYIYIYIYIHIYIYIYIYRYITPRSGESAGGNLAAAVTLKLRDINSEHRFRIQVLAYPALQALNFNTPSYQRNACDAILDRPWMIEFWMWYAVGSFPSDWLVRSRDTPV